MEHELNGEKSQGLKTKFVPRGLEINGTSIYELAIGQLIDPNDYINHSPDEIFIFNFSPEEAELWIKKLYNHTFRSYEDNVALHKEGVAFEDLYRYERRPTELLKSYQELTLGKIISDGSKKYSKTNNHEKERALANRAQAINLLIECNRGLIGKKVNEIKSFRLTNIYGDGDLFNEGSTGVFRAAEMFDYRKGFRFSTYVGWWIRQAIEKRVTEIPEGIRLPMRIGENLQKVMAIINEHSLDIYDPIDMNFLCDKTGLSPKQILKLLKSPKVIIFSDYIGNKGSPGESLAQRIEGDLESTESAEEEFFKQRKQEIITKLLTDIPENKDRRIVTLFMYGMSYREIGQDKLVDLTRQGVEYRLKTTLKELKKQYPELKELLIE